MMLFSRISVLVALFVTAAVHADDWPQWMGINRDGRWNETGILDKIPAGGLKKLWSAPIQGGYSGPAVVGDRVYVTDYVRAGGDGANNPSVMAESSGKERVLCLDATTGKEVWKHEYDCKYKVSYPAGPRCTPTVMGGQVYALGSMGDLRVLRAADGKLLWSKNFPTDFNAKVPMWGFCGHPLVHENMVVCLVGGDSLLYAFDKDSGKTIWKSLSVPSEGAGYCPPSIIEAGGTKQLIIWHPEKIVSLNPIDGKRFWDVPLKPAYGMSIMAPVRQGDHLFAGGIGFACVCVKLGKDAPTATEVWRGDQKAKNGVYPVNATPIIDDGIIYGVDQPGALRGVELATGKRLWWTHKPITGKDEEEERRVNSGTAFVVKNGKKYFLFGETGDIIIGEMSLKGYVEIGRSTILEKTHECFGRSVVWSHPAFARKCIFARNNKEIVCYSLAAE